MPRSQPAALRRRFWRTKGDVARRVVVDEKIEVNSWAMAFKEGDKDGE